MKVRFNESLATNDRVFSKGEEVELDSKVAKMYVEAGLVEAVGKAPAKRAETRKK
jgi:hypothetical protein